MRARVVVAAAVCLPVLVGGCASFGGSRSGAAQAAAPRVAPAPPGLPATEFGVAAPAIALVIGGPGPLRPTCAPDQITAYAATRSTSDGVLGVVRLRGAVIAHVHGAPVRCSVPVRHGPTRLLAADGRRLTVPLSRGVATSPPSNQTSGDAFADGDGIWGFAWLGSYCGARAASVQVPLHRAGARRLTVPLRGPQPACHPAAGEDTSILVDGVAGLPGDPVQPPRPEFDRLRLTGHIAAGSTQSRLAPVHLTLSVTGTTPVSLDPCPFYAGRDEATARSGGFVDPIDPAQLSCAERVVTVGPGHPVTWTVPGISLVQTPGTGARPGSTVTVTIGLAGIAPVTMTTTVH